MPYTPPAAPSPVASRSESLGHDYLLSTTQTQNHGTLQISTTSKSNPPYSSSRAYLKKHRRSPSVSKTSYLTGPTTPEDTPLTNANSDSDDEKRGPSFSGKARQSPVLQPIESSAAETSPPVSDQVSSDDEVTMDRGRTREIDIYRREQLQAAAEKILLNRAGSPNLHTSEEKSQARKTLGLTAPRLDSSAAKAKDSQSEVTPRLPLSAGARKISHSRSNTEGSAFNDFPLDKFDSPKSDSLVGSASVSDNEGYEDEDLAIKPPLIRKKSGQLVKPALRGASSTRRRPSSMPGTPTYSKAVHFQEQGLENVRHFNQVDRPIAVSAGSSPVDSYEDDSDFPFGTQTTPRSPPFEWEIRLANFPRDSPERSILPVKTERVFLSANTKTLIGAVAVRNLAFHKLVVARFTLDYWKTTSEIVAEYNNDVREKRANDGHDHFLFHIKLDDQTNLENKSLFFCVRYNVDGRDYWDNNNDVNYQVDFCKKFKPQKGKHRQQQQSAPTLNALPRSKPLSSSTRPHSGPPFDDFGSSWSPFELSNFSEPSAIVGDSPIRFKSNVTSRNLVPDAPRRPKANQQGLGDRYTFDTSLSAAKQASNMSNKEKGETTFQEAARSAAEKQPEPNRKPPLARARIDTGKQVKAANSSKRIATNSPKPNDLTAEKPPMQSLEYQEILEKFCYYGSGKPAIQPAKSPASPLDGAFDAMLVSNNDDGKNSPPAPHSPPIQENRTAGGTFSPRVSRSSSPVTMSAMGSRSASPASFRFPFYQSVQNGLFDTHTPTAIRG